METVSYDPWTPWTESHVSFAAPLPAALGLVVEERCKGGQVVSKSESVDNYGEPSESSAAREKAQLETVVVVSLIKISSPAEKAGISPGSVLARIDGKRVPFRGGLAFVKNTIAKIRDEDIALNLTLRRPTPSLERILNLSVKERKALLLLFAVGARRCSSAGAIYFETKAGTEIQVLLKCACSTLRLEDNAYFSVEPIVEGIGNADVTADDTSAIEASEQCIQALLSSPEKRAEALFSLLSCIVYNTDRGYDSVNRAVALSSARLLGFSSAWFYREELFLASRLMSDFKCCLRQSAKTSANTSTPTAESGSVFARYKKSFIVGGAAIAGGAIVGLTGGLAAPAIGHGLVVLGSAVGIGTAIAGTAAFLTSTAGVAVLASIFTATGAGLAGYKVHRRIKAIAEFKFQRLKVGHPIRPKDTTSYSGLGVTIAVSGFLLPSEVDAGGGARTWCEALNGGCSLTPSDEFYELVFETKELLKLGDAMSTLLAKEALKTVGTEALKQTMLQSIMAAVAWPATLLKGFDLIDNSWSVCINRADKAGVLLAVLLAERAHGARPVTLVGFSIGARVIFSCLKTLAAMAATGTYTDEEGKHVKSTFQSVSTLIHNAVLISAPVPNDEATWRSIRRVVAGELVNAYIPTDWLLGVVHRSSALAKTCAGIQPLKLHGVTDIDLTVALPDVTGHFRIRPNLKDILCAIKQRVKDGGA